MTIITNSPVHEEFKRPEIFKIRRKPLHSYLKALGHDFDFATTPVSALQDFVLKNGIDVSPLLGGRELGKPPEQRISSNMTNQELQSKMAALEKELAAFKSEKKEPTIGELRTACKEAGIKIANTDTKADLMEKLNG